MMLSVRVCPQCGEKIPSDDSCREIFCMYCGARVMIAESELCSGRFVLQDAVSDTGIDPEAVAISCADNIRTEVTVYCGNEPLVKIQKGKTIILPLPPGRYLLWARTGIEGARKEEFDITKGDRLQVTYRFPKGYEIVKL